jgi:uncharacterized protein (DUF58 family)
MKKIKINFKAFFLYLFGVVIMFLAGMSMGGFLEYLYYIMLIYPLLSVAHLIYSINHLKYYEKFSIEYPKKGDSIDYELTLANEALFPSANIFVRFKFMIRNILKEGNEIYLSINKKSVTKNYIINCPYRGIYTVGIESLELSDFLCWIKYKPEVFYRTFYVYPRIIEIKNFMRNIFKDRDTNITNRGGVVDYTIINSLIDYRSGESVKHVAWKKFIQTGIPYLKKYDSSTTSGISIYLDTRSDDMQEEYLLEREDCSVEILVSLVKYFLSQSIQVEVCAPGINTYKFKAEDITCFDDFYKSTFKIQFDSIQSPVKLFRNDLRDFGLSKQTVIFITHKRDPEIFNLIAEFDITGIEIIVIVNQSCMSSLDRAKIRSYIEQMKFKRNNIVIVNNSNTIKEDLQ